MERKTTAPTGVRRKAARSMKTVWLRYATHVKSFLTCVNSQECDNLLRRLE
jgi:hypothetical protein